VRNIHYKYNMYPPGANRYPSLPKHNMKKYKSVTKINKYDKKYFRILYIFTHLFCQIITQKMTLQNLTDRRRYEWDDGII
jgi:hypothetical protein